MRYKSAKLECLQKSLNKAECIYLFLNLLQEIAMNFGLYVFDRFKQALNITFFK